MEGRWQPTSLTSACVMRVAAKKGAATMYPVAPPRRPEKNMLMPLGAVLVDDDAAVDASVSRSSG